jgi:hypothetical protein
MSESKQTDEPVAYMFWNEPDTQRHFSVIPPGNYWSKVVPLTALTYEVPTPPGAASTDNHSFPEGFFDDQFEGTREEDTVLQAAAREAGWALSVLVDEIQFERRQHVVNIINRLSAALYTLSPPTREEGVRGND